MATTDTMDNGIDFDDLMDLRVDYAFKLFFGTGETCRLVSLLNAIFENKNIPRIITDLDVVNPFLERAAVDDKLSILDIRAELDDGSDACIEMHLYDIDTLKPKTLRSWARVYGEELDKGDSYKDQNVVICIAFMDGAISDAYGNVIERVHSLYQVMERDEHELLLPDMELHYIDMKEFANRYNELGEAYDKLDRFTRWLMLITHKKIKDKSAIRDIWEDDEMRDAVNTLAELSKDKIKRQAYQRRLDNLYYYNRRLQQIADKDAALAEKDAAIADMGITIAEKDATIADMGTALTEKDSAIADMGTTIADMGTALTEKDSAIAELQAQIAAIKTQNDKSD